MEPIPTYYGRPALKPSDWRWLIVAYLFIGGLAGAAQVIAGVVDLFGRRSDRPLVSAGRYLALLGALVSPVLLIADLKDPSRWYNMLRVFRGTSPMSIGSWTLVAFGGLSGLTALLQLAADALGVRWARGLARLVGVPAAATGGLLATYTGTLLSATSTPLWAAGARSLSAVFGLSGTSTAIAALTLVLQRASAPSATLRRLERLGLLVSLAELVLCVRLESRWKRDGVSGPLEEPPLAVPYRVGATGLAMVAPLVAHSVQILLQRELRALAALGSIAALAGGFTQRAVFLFAGVRSAERPMEYFRMAQ